MLYIPESILLQILSRLPVKSLLRFKCVDKLWYDLISSPEFITMHLNNYSSTSLLIETFDYHESIINVYVVSSLSTDTNLSATKVDLEGSLFNLCNGIVCLERSNDKIALWNPATKDLKELPHSNVKSRRIRAKVGFGFDPKTNDYKVLQMTNAGSFDRQFKLYSLRTNSWKELEPCCRNFHLPYIQGPTYVSFKNKSFLCWIGLDDSDWMVIVAFDLSDEKFEIVELRSNVANFATNKQYGMLVPFRESIALLIRIPSETGRTTLYDVWVNEDVSSFPPTLNKSWIKLKTITDDEGDSNSKYTKFPLGVLGNGQVIFQSERKKVVTVKGPGSRSAYGPDPENVTVHDIIKDQKIKYLVGTGVSNFAKVFLLRESLVAIS